MYYSHPCTVCSKVFYTYNAESDRYEAAAILAASIKQHLIEYNEDDRETQFDYGETFNAQYVNQRMTESDTAPSGGYLV